MKEFFVVFLLLVTANYSEENEINCTKFSIPAPSKQDLRTIKWEVTKVQAAQHVPILADYRNQYEMNKDYESYKEGLSNQDARLTITQIVRQYGFRLDIHTDIRTKDGYYLTLHRIPNHGNEVVFINHGLFGSSDDWFMQGQDSLPFVLAGLGYDVWLGNFRGNKYSTRHEVFTLDCAQYWDFSWDDIGNNDLPAMIDYITYKTEQRKLTFVGHTESTTAFFVLTSLKPDYNNKIASAIVLSPMAYNSNIKSPILRVLSQEDMIYNLRNAIGAYEFLSNENLVETLRNVLCGHNTMSQILCNNLAFLITGFNEKLLNMYNFYTISQKYPAGGSTKTLVHYAQNIKSGQFRRFDYPEAIQNIDAYGYINPPNYPVRNIKAKVSFVVSSNDCLSNVTDVLNLRDVLPNVGDVIYVNDYSSVDYLWATNARSQVYDTVVALIQKYVQF